MTSFQITISPKEKAAGRFVARVRRSIQKALAEEEKKRNLNQSDIARALDVNRSVISREIRGHKDITLSRVAELAWALGRDITFDLPVRLQRDRSNMSVIAAPKVEVQNTSAPNTLQILETDSLSVTKSAA